MSKRNEFKFDGLTSCPIVFSLGDVMDKHDVIDHFAERVEVLPVGDEVVTFVVLKYYQSVN